MFGNDQVLQEFEMTVIEKAILGEITDSEKQYLLEKFENIKNARSPLRNFQQKLLEIKNTKPRNYDGPKEFKEFVDKNYDTVVKAAKLLEKDHEKLAKDDIEMLKTFIITWLGSGVAALVGGTAVAVGGAMAISGTAMVPGAIIATAGGAISVVAMIASIVNNCSLVLNIILKLVRHSDDVKAMQSLNAIQKSIDAVNPSKLPEDVRKKISDMSQSITDAKSAFSNRFGFGKVANENTYDSIRLAIYDKAYFGEITEAERDILLNKLCD